MRIPLNWLKEYVDIKVSINELSDRLTMSGTENEILHAEKGDFGGIVVGEILAIEKHPNADKLQITKTAVGKETLQIVCGAPNIEVGQRVPVALVGAQIGEFEIKEAELRGVKSFGMLCSEAELGISDDHSGIMVLDPRAKVGDKLSSALNVGGDQVLEAELTPNRGDCLSMIGVAREVAVITGQKLKLPIVKVQEIKEKASDFLSVEIHDNDLCRRYIGRVIKNIKIGPSPKWMQDRLASSGVRPINNVVDVTNYVMLEMGQPLHAFDADKISGGKIVVRGAKSGEKITTLDGVIRELSTDNLVIADAEKAVAIAGVMGGANSEVTNNTTTVVLESANFHPTSVRKTALKLALRSESSTRFEKGLSLKLTKEAADRAASLLVEVAGGEVLSGKVDAGEKKDKERKVVLTFDRIKSFLGEDIPAKKATDILEILGFKVLGKDKEKVEVDVPYWRLDVSIEEDLLEEVARIYGYENIPSTLPEGKLPLYEKNEKVEISKKIREVLAALGFFEVYSYSFTNKDKAMMFWGGEELIKIANPLSQEQEYMRADLQGSLLEIVSKNKDYNIGDIQKIYEIASVYTKKGEKSKLSGLVWGSKKETIFSVAKGLLESLFNELGVLNISLKNLSENKASVYAGKVEVGSFVILNSEELAKLKVKSKCVCFFELDIERLGRACVLRKFKSIPRFPVSTRDLTFILDEEFTVEGIKKTIDVVKSNIRVNFNVIDVYRGKGMAEGKKSVSVRFTYQAVDRTLTDKEVDDDQKAITINIKEELGGEIRGGNI